MKCTKMLSSLVGDPFNSVRVKRNQSIVFH